MSVSHYEKLFAMSQEIVLEKNNLDAAYENIKLFRKPRTKEIDMTYEPDFETTKFYEVWIKGQRSLTMLNIEAINPTEARIQYCVATNMAQLSRLTCKRVF